MSHGLKCVNKQEDDKGSKTCKRGRTETKIFVTNFQSMVRE